MAIELENNLPKGKIHDVQEALIEVIYLNKLETGECIIFGDKLVIVKSIEHETLISKPDEEVVPTLYKIEYYDITTGQYNAFRNMPENTLFHRVFKATISIIENENPREAYMVCFQRIEKDMKPGCAICGQPIIGDNWNESQGVVIHNACPQPEPEEEHHDEPDNGAEAAYEQEQIAKAEDDARRSDEEGHHIIQEEPDNYDGCGEFHE